MSPHDTIPEEEVWVAGAWLLDADEAARATRGLEVEAFGSRRLRKIVRTAQRLHDRGEEVGLYAVSKELQRTGELEEVGGSPFLADLLEKVPTTAELDQYVAAIREDHYWQQLQGLENLLRVAPDSEDRTRLLEEIESRARSLQNGVLSGNALPPTAGEILADPEERLRPQTVADRVAWRGMVTLFAGREKMGKSTLTRFAVARRSRGLHLWSARETEDGPLTTVYWGQERPVDIAADLDRIGSDLDAVRIRDMRREPGDRPSLLAHDVEAVEPDLIVIDTLSTYTDAMDLDQGDAGDWEPVMNRLGALAQEADAAVLVVHHARKSDGSYRGSTAIGASVDCILEMHPDRDEGETARRVKASARSAVPARGFKYVFSEFGGTPYLEILDGSLSVEERVQRYIQANDGCSQREVIDGVRGRTDDIRATLQELVEGQGPVKVDASSTPYKYSVDR